MRLSVPGSRAFGDFMLALGHAGMSAEVIPVVLRHSTELLGGAFARLVLIENGEERCWTFQNGNMAVRTAEPLDDLLRDASVSSPGEAVQHRFVIDGSVGHAVVSRTPSNDDEFVMLAVGRWGRRRFDDQAHSLMERIFELSAMSLENMRLVKGLRERTETLEHLADHDHLTGLSNRLRFQREAEWAIANGRAGAVLLIDLDRFKEVNDTLGHQIGDELLIEVARRVRSTVCRNGLIARLGGDEFAVLLENSTLREVLAISEELHNHLERPVEIGEFEVDVGASIGVAMASPETGSLGTLLRQADVAMYAAKEARGAIEVYRPELDHYRPEALALVPQFRGAVESDELHVAFQAQYDTHSQQIVGAEALARWSVTGFGPVPPSEFIPIAESTGLIHPLTHRVLGEAIDQCASWQTNSEQVRVSVNIAPRVLLEPGLADRISDLLAIAGLPPSCLRMEVTETTVMTDPGRTVAALHQLSERGISVAIDDFGTGHSSLAYLTTLPCHELKIDRSFITALDRGDPRAEAVVAAVIGLGRDLGIDVIAEGVETPGVVEQLQQMGCRVIQGFLFSRPVSALEFTRVLAGTPTKSSPFSSVMSMNRRRDDLLAADELLVPAVAGPSFVR